MRFWIVFSIHASAKEATVPQVRRFIFIKIFNPRLREGGDLMESGVPIYTNDFSIHASAKEATLFHFHTIPCLFFFNPRLREGGDKYLKVNGGVILFSIHASAKEATSTHLGCQILVFFQSTPPRRRRLKLCCPFVTALAIFNPRLREGGDAIRQRQI